MKRIKVKLVGRGTKIDRFRVNLPTYRIDIQRDQNGKPVLNGEGEFVDSINYERMECYVLVPDDEVEEVAGKTKLSQTRIRQKYKNWKDFQTSDVEVVT